MSEETKAEVKEAEPQVVSAKDHKLTSIEDKLFGQMAVAEARGTYSGSKLVAFSAFSATSLADNVNEYFEKNRGLLVVDAKYEVNSDGLVYGFYIVTQQQSNEYVAKLGELQSRIATAMAEEKAKELEEEHKAELAAIEKQKEERRLLALGRQCEAHHKPVIEENKKLKDELKKAKKGK
jgi:signal transduction histidine kinase